MKNIIIRTKFDNCKSLREIFDNINESFFEKSSYFLLNIWILYPLLMMIINYFFNGDIARNMMYMVLFIISIFGIVLGILYCFKRFYKNEKICIKKYLPIILGLILLFWCCFTTFFSINSNISFFGTNYRKEGLQTYFFYVGVFILGIILKNKEMRIKLCKNLLFVEIIMCIITLLNNSLTNLLFHNYEPYTGIFSQFNHYGYYLMFGILISIFMYIRNEKIKNKILYLLCFGLLFYTLLINDTFGCFLAFLITFIFIIIYFILIKRRIKVLLPIIIIFVLNCGIAIKNDQNVVYKNFKGLLVDLTIINEVVKDNAIIEDDEDKQEKLNKLNYIGTTRGTLWRYGIKYIMENPIIGHGIESTALLYRNDNINQSRPHNILLQFGIFTGIPGMLLYISFILSILIRSIRKIKIFDEINIFILFIVICYLISSMFGNSMFYTSPYFMIFLGMLTSKIFYIKNKKEKWFFVK